MHANAISLIDCLLPPSPHMESPHLWVILIHRNVELWEFS